jgi:hypothetical protein
VVDEQVEGGVVVQDRHYLPQNLLRSPSPARTGSAGPVAQGEAAGLDVTDFAPDDQRRGRRSRSSA